MPIFANDVFFFFLENIGPAAAGPAGPVPTPMVESVTELFYIKRTLSLPWVL